MSPLARLLSGIAIAASAGMPAAVQAADCTCRAQGRDFELGRSICLSTPSGFRLATCDMVLNNTSWRTSATPCVGVSIEPDFGDPQQQARSGQNPHSPGG